MEILDLVRSCEGFDWDADNLYKNWLKHNVSAQECEHVFSNTPLLLQSDLKHSDSAEERFLAMGKTDNGRRLFVVFTVHRNLIRVISARNMSRYEREIYEAAH